MWTTAIEDAVSKTRSNIERFGQLYPHVSKNEVYSLNDNNAWTSSFWSGMLWLCYEYTEDEAFLLAARGTTESFRDRLAQKKALNNHDIGFLYTLSSKAQWIVENDESAKQLTIAAAELLLARWRPKSGIIQAWGSEGHEEYGGRMIIDCMMNLPLLYWAGEMTGDHRYSDAAAKHADKSRRFLIRGDDSSYHTFYFDQETGDAIHGATHQGYADGSTWTRGQAWGVYGFALSYRYTRNPLYLETSLRMARYFLERLPEDNVVYWDFDAPINADTKRDSSASAITVSALLELLEHLPTDHPERDYLVDGVQRSIKGLIGHYATIGKPDAQGLLERGSYSVKGGASPDDFMIWGDYFYLEALMRLEQGHKGYW